MKKAILAALLVALASSAFADRKDRKMIYVGDGRYVCEGSGCDVPNARERQYEASRDAERYERWRMENSMRDLQRRSSSEYGGIIAVPSAGENSAGAPPTYIYVPTR